MTNTGLHAGLPSAQQQPMAAETARAKQQERANPPQREEGKRLSEITQRAMTEAGPCRRGGRVAFGQRVVACRAVPGEIFRVGA